MAPAANPIRWGTVKLPQDEPTSYELGNLVITLARSRLEWSVEYLYHQDRYVNESSKQTSRFRVIDGHDDTTISFTPATADRNVVVRPAQTLHIPGGESARLYIGTPLWLKISAGDSLSLLDLPTEILSDTWFGASTREGEVCYANQTQARLYLEKLSQRPDRLITPVTISNQGEDNLVIERLNLPLPRLSIYDTGHSPWTQEVNITRSGTMETAEIDISSEAPAEHPDGVLTGAPRLADDGTLMNRAIDLLMDHRRSL